MNAALLVLVVAGTFWFLTALRILGVPFIVAAWVFYCRVGHPHRFREVVFSLLLVVLISFSPIDISPIHVPNRWPPHIVPLSMGLPLPETVERARRGDVVLGGCIVSGYEPKYMIVW